MRPCCVLVTGLFVLAGSVRWQAAPSIRDTSPDRLTVQEAMAAVDMQAIQLAQQDQFSGALLMARGGKLLLEKAYGWADRDRHLRNTTNTKFRIGSINKMFTATAILQLVGEGKVQIGAPVGKYLPDYLNPIVAQRVTARQLLTHKGGPATFSHRSMKSIVSLEATAKKAPPGHGRNGAAAFTGAQKVVIIWQGGLV